MKVMAEPADPPGTPPAEPPRKPLSPAAQRALAEAAERRARAQQAERAPEHQGRGGLDPVRYTANAQATGYAHATAHIDVSVSRELTIELAAAAFIEGRVVAADGSPAAGAEVFASGGPEAATATG